MSLSDDNIQHKDRYVPQLSLGDHPRCWEQQFELTESMVLSLLCDHVNHRHLQLQQTLWTLYKCSREITDK